MKVVYIGIMDDYVGGNSWAYGMKGFARLKMLSVFSPIEKIVSDLNNFQPQIIMTKPSLLGELARQQRDSNLKINLKNVIFAGEMISPNDASDIEKYFGVKPRNSYSTCETGPISFQMQGTEEGLNIFEDLVWLELLDDNNQPIKEYYEAGNIVVTNLYNKIMPIIRYKIGDKAYYIPNESNKHFNKISYIQGRNTTYFTFEDKNQTKVKVSEFPFWSLYIPGILRYQVIQESMTVLKVKIEWEKNIAPDKKNTVLDNFCNKIKRILNSHHGLSNITISIENVPKILPNSNGKIQITFPLKQ
jgi:phenylacetate-coenzyme A ligase PaaK-like adenylate-forming protein